MRILRKNRLVVLILFIALLFRLTISPYGDNHDLLTTAGWGEWVYKHGPKGFYENNVWIYSWPTQLPLINLIHGFNYYLFDQKLLWLFSYIAAVLKTHHIFPQYFSWWFNFVDWFGNGLFQVSPFRNGFMISMKLIPIISDLLIALVIYLIGKRMNSRKVVIISLLFLFLPFSWYISSLWGQYDQLSSLLLLLSFLSLYKKNFIISSVLFFLSIQIKPTTSLFGIFYIFYFLFQKPSIKNILLSLITNIVIFIFITSPFSAKNPFLYTLESILPKVFNSDRYGLVNHAFNFWQMIAPFGGWSTTFTLVWIPALYWGLALLVLINFWAVKTFRKVGDLKGLIMALFLIGGGSYLFGTGMVDRYFYSSLIFFGLLIFYFPKLFIWWIIASLIFSVNLFYSWGFPILNDLTAWKNEWIIRFFSFLNIIVFIICLSKMKILKSND